MGSVLFLKGKSVWAFELGVTSILLMNFPLKWPLIGFAVRPLSKLFSLLEDISTIFACYGK